MGKVKVVAGGGVPQIVLKMTLEVNDFKKNFWEL